MFCHLETCAKIFDWLKISLLLNPQFLANPYETWLKLIAYEYVKLLEYQLDWIRIIDFSLCIGPILSQTNFFLHQSLHNYRSFTV